MEAPSPHGEPRSGPADQAMRLLEALEEGVLVVEAGRLRGANAALARMAGLPVETLVGKRVSELFTDPGGRPLAELASSDAVRLRDARGELRPVSLRAVDSRTAVVVDRARERRLEQEVWRLSEAGCDPGSRSEALPGAELAGMIEHEIGTAATVIRGYLRMLLEERGGPLTPQQRGFLLEARRETERIGSLLADLLELAATHAVGALRVTRKPVRLHPLVESAVEGTRPLLDERGMSVELELELSDDELLIDPGRVEQVLANLLTNAAKFAPRGSAVKVATHLVEEDCGPRACLSVIDEGPGIAAEEAERILKPFVRGGAGSGARGIGLGLAVCRAVAEAHGGRIEAVPSLGYGLFRLVLPVDS